MKLSPDEDSFLRHWIYDEARYLQGQGPAKRLQVDQQVRPADLALLIAAAIPDPAEQLAIAEGPPPAEPPRWPWSAHAFQDRLVQARQCVDLVTEGNAPSAGA